MDHTQILTVEAYTAKLEAITPPVVRTCLVPKAFDFRPDHHATVRVDAGTQELPAEIYEHWWAKVHGVTLYQPGEAPQAPAKAPKAPAKAPKAPDTL